MIEENANSIPNMGGKVMHFPVCPSIITVSGLKALRDLIKMIFQVNNEHCSEAMLLSNCMSIRQ